MPHAVLGIGGNLGDRERNIVDALQQIQAMEGSVIQKVSRLYETEPFDVISEQNKYLNCCVLICSKLGPEKLLAKCQEIENQLGRIRNEYHGARTMDIDILVYEGETRNDEKLKLPHPEISKRAFVLVPLRDIFADLKVYGFDYFRDYSLVDKTEVTPFQTEIVKKLLGDKSWKLGLERMSLLNELMGDPQGKLKFIHIAGTNGKGSTANMITHILMQSGYTVGLFTSPHIQVWNEMIQVNNEYISDKQATEILEQLDPLIDQMEDKPSQFEVYTAMAFLHFVQMHCDIVVLEVGLGGRLDSTNIITNVETAVITNIGLDHMKQLGNTLEKIAAEKAAIIKPDVDVILYRQEPIVHDIVLQKCKDENAQLTIADLSKMKVKKSDLTGHIVSYGDIDDIFIPLIGQHQLKNAATAIETVLNLRKKAWNISDLGIRNGLANTILPARFEIVNRSPIVVLDGAHNPQGMEGFVNNLAYHWPNKKVIFVVGILADKDYSKMMQLIIPIAKRIYTVTPENTERALSSDALAGSLNELAIAVESCGSPANGIQSALEASDEEDIICAAGSLSIANAIRSFFNLIGNKGDKNAAC